MKRVMMSDVEHDRLVRMREIVKRTRALIALLEGEYTTSELIQAIARVEFMIGEDR